MERWKSLDRAPRDGTLILVKLNFGYSVVFSPLGGHTGWGKNYDWVSDPGGPGDETNAYYDSDVKCWTEMPPEPDKEGWGPWYE